MPATMTISLVVTLLAVLPLTTTALVAGPRSYEVSSGWVQSDANENRGHFSTSLPRTKREITRQQLEEDELTGMIASCIGHGLDPTPYLNEKHRLEASGSDAATQDSVAEKIAYAHIDTPDPDSAVMGGVYTDADPYPEIGYLSGEGPGSMRRGKRSTLQRRSNGWWANMLNGLSSHNHHNHHHQQQHHSNHNDHLNPSSSNPSIGGSSAGGISAPLFSPPPSSGPVSSADWDSSGSGRGSNGGNGMGWGMGDGACDEDGVEFRPSGPMWRAGGK